MKKITLLLLLSTVVLMYNSCKKQESSEVEEEDPTTTVPCVPSGLSANVLAFYSFATGSLNDVSGNSHHLTNTSTAAPTTDRNGNAGCAYKFDRALNEFLFTTNTTFLNSLSQFSVSLWYKPSDSARDGGMYEQLIVRDTGKSCPDRTGQWSVALYDCRRAVYSRQNFVWDKLVVPFGSSHTCADEVAARTGSWHHITATWNGAGNTVCIYRDGVLQDTKTGITSCTTLDKGDLIIGKGYTGSIDDIIIFNKTLTQAEAAQLATMETCCTK